MQIEVYQSQGITALHVVIICIWFIFIVFSYSCEICKGRLFDKKESKCPVCDRFVSKSDLLEKSPERRKIDKLIELRKRVLSIYNKKANNFKSLKEYDNYLEHIEDLVTGLYENNLEVENEVRNYEKQNQYEISKNREKEEEEKEKVTKIIEKEKDSINKLKEERLNEIELLKQQIIDENYKSQQEIGVFLP